MTRASEQAERERRQQLNEPLVRKMRGVGWTYVCPQAHGVMYDGFPNLEAVFRDWSGHSKAQHPERPIGWPEGLAGRAAADRHRCVPTTAEKLQPGIMSLLCQRRHVMAEVPVGRWAGSQAERDLDAAHRAYAAKKVEGRPARARPVSEDQGSLF